MKKMLIKHEFLFINHPTSRMSQGPSLEGLTWKLYPRSFHIVASGKTP